MVTAAETLRAAADRLDESDTSFVIVELDDNGDPLGAEEVEIGEPLAAWLRMYAAAFYTNGTGHSDRAALTLARLILGGDA